MWLAAIKEAREPEAAQGYVHPLGFWHIALPSRSIGKIRLHAWSLLAPGIGLASVHNHSFSFTSIVLRGAIRHTPFLVEEAATNSDADKIYQVRRVEQQGNETLLIDTGRRVTAEAGIPRLYESGQSYTFQEDGYHISEMIGTEPAMTLLAATPAAAITSCVLLDAKTEHNMSWTKRWLTPRQIARSIDEAIERLADLDA